MSWGAIIGAAGSVAGGLLGSSSARKNQERALAFQREMAQNQIKWRVADARQAGISPLAALGASLYQGSWTSTGNDLGDGIAAAAGQIAQGINERQQQKMAAELHGAQLDKLRSETAESAARAGLLRAEQADMAVRLAHDSMIKRAQQVGNVRQDGAQLGYQVPADSTRFVGGMNVPHGPQSDQQEIEDRYGGIVGEGAGFLSFIRDIWTDYMQTYQDTERFKALQKSRRQQAENMARDPYRGPKY